MADTTVNARSLAAATHTTLSAPLRWLAAFVAEVLPWLTLLGAVAALLTIAMRHLGGFLTEAQAWAKTNIESRGSKQTPAAAPSDTEDKAA